MDNRILELVENIRQLTIANTTPRYPFSARGTTTQEQQVLELNKTAAMLVGQYKSGDKDRVKQGLNDVESKLAACFFTGIFVEKDFQRLVDSIEQIRKDL